jgi:hypothetical protein
MHARFSRNARARGTAGNNRRRRNPRQPHQGRGRHQAGGENHQVFARYPAAVRARNSSARTCLRDCRFLGNFSQEFSIFSPTFSVVSCACGGPALERRPVFPPGWPRVAVAPRVLRPATNRTWPSRSAARHAYQALTRHACGHANCSNCCVPTRRARNGEIRDAGLGVSRRPAMRASGRLLRRRLAPNYSTSSR